MKKLLSILLLLTIAATAHAGKSHKATVKSKALKTKQQQSAQPIDTTKHVQYNVRELDARMGRSMYVAPAQPQSRANKSK